MKKINEEAKAKASSKDQTKIESAQKTSHPALIDNIKSSITDLAPTSNSEETLKQNTGTNKEPEPNSVSSKKPVDPKFSNISTYNGGKNDKYSWSQAISDVIVQVDLDTPTKSKDLDVTLDHKHIKVVRKATKQSIFEGEFYDAIKVEDSTWSIEEGSRLILNLEKAQENIWKIVLKGDPEIDATKVDNTKTLDDFDPETQGALRKIVYEQNRKAQGLPTTDEEKQMEMLKKAWDAEGSPFKGTPFDPSRLNMPQPGQNPGSMPDGFPGK